MRINRRSALAAFAALALSAGAAACGGDDSGGSGSGSSGTTKAAGGDEGGTIALLLPETKTTRYEEQDKPRFEAKVKELCPNCKVIYENANQDAARQQQQAEAAITNGAKVLVLDAVDAKAATATVNRAKQSNIPVIAYDRLISGAPISYFVSFDNVRVGKMQAQALLDKLGDAERQVDRDAQRLADGPELGRLQEGRARGLRLERREDRARVRHARLEPGQGPAGDRAGDHRARQGQGRGRLLGQRRHDRRRDRRHEVGRHRPQDGPDDRPGLRGRRDPADPHRRAVHDDLPGDQAAGRGGRAARRRPRQGHRRRTPRWSTTRPTTAPATSRRSCWTRRR